MAVGLGSLVHKNMHCRAVDSRAFRLLNVLDDFNREGIGIVGDFSSRAQPFIPTINRAIESRGNFGTIRVDISENLMKLDRNLAFLSSTSNLGRTPISSAATAPSGLSGRTDTSCASIEEGHAEQWLWT
jgi:hypothetical protein